MLAYFPTPYPNEWWYSVLCRYYVRSGFCHFSDIAIELYQNQKSQPHEVLYPTGFFLNILKQLPDIGLSAKDILLNHTLAPYYFRFYPAERKTAELNALMSDQKSATNCRTVYNKAVDGGEGPKYCPQCYKEDEQKYGEPYWHREHQIPLISLCPYHGCVLQQHPIKFSQLKSGFYPLCDIRAIQQRGTESEKVWAYPLTQMLYNFLTLPFDVAPIRESSSLYNAMLRQSVFVKISKGRCCVSLENLKIVCLSYYGESITKNYFGDFSQSSMGAIKRWECPTPERYALLSVLCGVTAEELFGVFLPNQEPQGSCHPRKKWEGDDLSSRKTYIINSGFSVTEMELLQMALRVGGEKDIFQFAHNAVLEKAKAIIQSNTSST